MPLSTKNSKATGLQWNLKKVLHSVTITSSGVKLWTRCMPSISKLLGDFYILISTSWVVSGGIRLPFELDCHRRTDELVIIATRPNLLGKRACPSDILPVLWRGQWRHGFTGPHFQALPLMPVRVEVVAVWVISRTWSPNLPSVLITVEWSCFTLTLY